VQQPPPAIESAAFYYLERNDEDEGVFSGAQLIALWGAGQIRRTDLIRLGEEGKAIQASHYVDLFPESDVRRCDDQVIMTPGSALPMRCIKTGGEVVKIEKRTLVRYRGLRAPLYYFLIAVVLYIAVMIVMNFLKMERFLASVDPEFVEVIRTYFSGGLISSSLMLFAALSIAVISLERISRRKKRFTLEYGVSAACLKKRRMPVLFSCLVMIVGLGIAGYGTQMSYPVLSIGLGLMVFVVGLKLISSARNPLMPISIADKFLAFRGVDESFLQPLSVMTAEERDALVYNTNEEPRNLGDKERQAFLHRLFDVVPYWRTEAGFWWMYAGGVVMNWLAWSARFGSSETLLTTIIILKVGFDILAVVALIICMTGDIFQRKLTDRTNKATLKKWGRGNRVAALILLVGGIVVFVVRIKDVL